MTCLRRQIFRFCTAAFYHSGSDITLRELSFLAIIDVFCLVIKLENIQAVNYVETTVEWEQWAGADSDSE